MQVLLPVQWHVDCPFVVTYAMRPFMFSVVCQVMRRDPFGVIAVMISPSALVGDSCKGVATRPCLRTVRSGLMCSGAIERPA